MPRTPTYLGQELTTEISKQMLPVASVSFTVPSIHDGNRLACRLYYPNKQRLQSGSPRLKAAILAHPYAALGGSFDDPVLATVGKTLLKTGYIVTTFNFRGARGSAGRTSWSGKPELADYVSVYGFMVYYLDNVKSSGNDKQYAPLLVLGGYSYGSMIASHTPSLQTILQVFNSPSADSPEAEVLLRAQELSAQFIDLAKSQQQDLVSPIRGRQSLHSPTSPPHSVAIGGSESMGLNYRTSRESSRTSLDLDGVRRSMHKIRHKLEHRKSSGVSPASASIVYTGAPKNPVPEARICSLLISPLLPPVAGFTTMFSKLSFSPKAPLSLSPNEAGQELLYHPACAIYGDSDIFTSKKKLRQWVEECKQKSTSDFTAVEVANTGHFWHEAGSDEKLKEAVKAWAEKIEDAAQAERLNAS